MMMPAVHRGRSQPVAFCSEMRPAVRRVSYLRCAGQRRVSAGLSKPRRLREATPLHRIHCMRLVRPGSSTVLSQPTKAGEHTYSFRPRCRARECNANDCWYLRPRDAQFATYGYIELASSQRCWIDSALADGFGEAIYSVPVISSFVFLRAQPRRSVRGRALAVPMCRARAPRRLVSDSLPAHGSDNSGSGMRCRGW
jgi:hypothetical protein